MKTKVHCYLAVCLGLAAACSSGTPVPQEDAPMPNPGNEDPRQLSFQGDWWTLESWTADPEILTATRRRPSISFGKGKFHASPGVNSMSGKYSAKQDGRIVINGGAITEMAGDPATMDAEEMFLTLLGRVTHWKLQKKTLVLSNGTPDMEMRFGPPEPVKALPLPGTEWRLEGFEKTGGQAVSFTSLVTGTAITLSIGADGRATGSAGINRYFGKAAIGEGDTITFGPMASTRRGGPPKAMAQERAYLKQLQTASRWKVHGNSLVLTGNDNSFALVYEAK